MVLFESVRPSIWSHHVFWCTTPQHCPWYCSDSHHLSRHPVLQVGLHGDDTSVMSVHSDLMVNTYYVFVSTVENMSDMCDHTVNCNWILSQVTNLIECSKLILFIENKQRGRHTSYFFHSYKVRQERTVFTYKAVLRTEDTSTQTLLCLVYTAHRIQGNSILVYTAYLIKFDCKEPISTQQT